MQKAANQDLEKNLAGEISDHVQPEGTVTNMLSLVPNAYLLWHKMCWHKTKLLKYNCQSKFSR